MHDFRMLADILLLAGVAIRSTRCQMLLFECLSLRWSTVRLQLVRASCVSLSITVTQQALENVTNRNILYGY